MIKKDIKFTKSYRLFNKALDILPAGVSSNARLWHGVCPTYAPCSIFIKKARGSKIWDVDGNKFIDYRLGYGPVILGHSFPAVRQALHRAENKGQVYALDNELEIEVAQTINKFVPHAQMVRFSNSGTEATMSALRIARGYTKKEKVIKFEGHYHGAHDYLLYSTDPDIRSLTMEPKPIPMSMGIPKDIEKYILVEEWNSFEAIEKMVRENNQDVAAIITEPVMGNAAGIPPKEGYLNHLQELCERYNIMLIFDEVKTGFRLAQGGAQEFFKVKPHISCFAKSLGNGYPIAAVAGLKEVMDIVKPGGVMHGGTYSANPVSLAAAKTTLSVLAREKVWTHLRTYGKKLMHGIHEILNDAHCDNLMLGYPEMFQFVFTKREHIHNYRDLAHVDMNMYAKFQYEMLARGVMFDEDNEECIFTSFSHDTKDLNQTLAAMRDSVKDVKGMQKTPLRYV